MNVKELNQNQIEELRITYFYDVPNNYNFFGDIPDEVIFNHFDGIDFVNDDFGCTANS